MVVKAAAEKKSPLHARFDWDDKSAAHKHRLEQAGELIRRVRVEVQTSHISIQVPAYIAKVHSHGYRSIQRIPDSEQGETLARELMSARGHVLRVVSLASAWGRTDMVRRLTAFVSYMDKEIDKESE
jgi:hypothetical protein